jgi:hypothetical protein
MEEVLMERNEEIIVLDTGNEGGTLVTPELFCCAGAFTFFMG